VHRYPSYDRVFIVLVLLVMLVITAVLTLSLPPFRGPLGDDRSLLELVEYCFKKTKKPKPPYDATKEECQSLREMDLRP
jgi:hypothetical protein